MLEVRIPAMRGKMGSRTYYSCLMPMSGVPQFFKFTNWVGISPEDREQRVLNEKRIPALTKYIEDNEDEYAHRMPRRQAALRFAIVGRSRRFGVFTRALSGCVSSTCVRRSGRGAGTVPLGAGPSLLLARPQAQIDCPAAPHSLPLTP